MLWEGPWTNQETCDTDKGFGMKRNDVLRGIVCFYNSGSSLGRKRKEMIRVWHWTEEERKRAEST